MKQGIWWCFAHGFLELSVQVVHIFLIFLLGSYEKSDFDTYFRSLNIIRIHTHVYTQPDIQ